MAIRTVQKAVILTALFAVAFGLRPFTVHDLHAITRVAAPTVSQTQVVFGTRSWNEDTKATTMKLNIVPVGRATPARFLTVNSPTAAEYSPVFSPDGTVVAFQGDDSKTIYQVLVATGAVSVLATLPVDVGSFKFSPTGTFIVFSAKVYLDCSDPQLDCTAAREGKTKDLGANTGFTYTRLYVRHWDTWETEGEYNHLFALPVTQNADKTFKVNGAPFDLMYKMSVASPVPPFGGSEEFDISPDGSEVTFTAETIAPDTAWKTGWKVYRVAATQGAIPQLITGFTAARCQDPQYSPDGKTIAYKAMDRPGLESDKDHLNFYDRASGKTFTPTMPWDRSISAATYGWDNDTLFLDADEDGSHKLWQYKVSSNSFTMLVKDGHVSSVTPVPGGSQNIIVYSLDTMSAPADLYQFTVVNSQPTDEKPLTSYNHDLLGGVYMSQADKFYFPSNGAQVQGFILYPFGFDPTKKYPLAQLIHGGPEGAWLDNWSYRWNPQLWASAGYVTVAINPHGSSGFGQAFQDAVQHDWGGVPYQDLMTGNDFVVKNYSFVDANNMAACGASYGGFMINWINGHTDRFKALVCHDGLFSAMAMYYASEEVFFNEAEFGPPPYTSSAAREAYERNSPQNFVQNWKTPTLVVHGGRDYRIPISEGLSAFTALQRKGVPSKLLHYPMENHWVLNSANSIMWYENVLGWLDAWTKPSKAKKEL